MANNITVKDASGASVVLKTTDNAGVETPHHNVDALPGTVESDIAAIKTAVELLDNAISGSEMQVDVVTQPALARTTDAVAVATQTDAIMNGATALTPKFAVISASSSGDNTIVAAVTSKKIRVLGYVIVAAGTVGVTWKSGTGGTALSGLMSLTANTGIAAAYCPVGLLETGSGVLLNLTLDAAVAVTGHLVYIEV